MLKICRSSLSSARNYVTSVLIKFLTFRPQLFIWLSLAFNKIVHILNRIEQIAFTFTACPCTGFCNNGYGEIIRLSYGNIVTIGFS